MAAWPVASNGNMELPAAISAPLIKSRLVISLINLFTCVARSQTTFDSPVTLPGRATSAAS
tara:strand:- start:794 stop:976 length:183 start_codon:yes stop_codon:yes gene_type:complete